MADKEVGTSGSDTVENSDPTGDAISRGIERWQADNLRDTAFSRDTGAWNVLQGALPLLAPAIMGEMGK